MMLVDQIWEWEWESLGQNFRQDGLSLSHYLVLIGLYPNLTASRKALRGIPIGGIVSVGDGTYTRVY